jgi:hypothetical protein
LAGKLTDVMKVLIVCLHAADRVPGQRFRFEQYLDFLENNGVDCTYSGLLEEKDYKYFHGKGHYFRKLGIVIKGFLKRRRELKSIRLYDIVFIQREAFMLGSTWFERKYAKRSKIIYDYDDAIVLFPGATGYSVHNRIRQERSSVYQNLFLQNHTWLCCKFNQNVAIVPPL